MHFKKNQKRMTPYEIRPSAQPKIDIKLDFFLTDNKNEIPAVQTTVDC